MHRRTPIASDYAAVIRRWASATPSSDSCPSWNPVHAMVVAAMVQSRELALRLRLLLDQSDVTLQPFGDPLRADIGLNRWLKSDREEAYSDWLAWTLLQVGAADAVLNILGIFDDSLVSSLRDAQVKISREEVIPGGRLDIVIRFGCEALLVVEIKKSSAEDAATTTSKQEGYKEWSQKECETKNLLELPAKLLVANAENETYFGFKPLRWIDVCIELRALIPKLYKRMSPVKVAMVVAFVAAVETNLLSLSIPGESDSAKSLFYGTTCMHIERALRRQVTE